MELQKKLSNWKNLKIKDIAPLQRGFDLPVSQINAGSYPVVFSNGSHKNHSIFKVTGPGVITGRSGTIGKVYYIDENYWPHNTALWVTDFKGNLPKYIYYFYINLNLNQFSAGSGVPTLNRNDVHAYRVMIPPLPEQHRIVAVLETWDAAIEKLKKKIELKKNIKKGLMQQLLTGKKRLPGYSGKWKSGSLNQFCKINSKSKSIPQEFNYIDLESVKAGFLNITKRLNKDFAPSRAQRVLEKNDILFQLVRPYQMNNYYFDLTGDYVASTGYAMLRANGSPRFLYYKLHETSFVTSVLDKCTGSNYPAINSNDLGNLKVQMPELEEQKSISSILTVVDQEIAKIAIRLTILESQKNYLLNNLVTGKILTPENLLV